MIRRQIVGAFAMIFVGLAGRALLDKILALRGGPDMVGLWAQLQSVADLVSGVALVGLGQGLTVLVAQTAATDRRRQLVRVAVRLGLQVALAMAAMLVLGVLMFPAGLDARGLPSSHVLMAAAAGCCTVLPGMLIAYCLGCRHQGRAAVLSLLGIAPLLVAAFIAPMPDPRFGMMVVQGAGALLIGVAWGLAGRGGGGSGVQEHQGEHQGEDRRALVGYLPVGLAIGILSPLSVLVVRDVLSSALSWHEAGLLQALWRTTEWVSGVAQGVINLFFLPRLGAAAIEGKAALQREIGRALGWVMIPAGLLLVLLYGWQREALSMLYDSRFVVSDRAVALFLVGDWLRIASWIFLGGLFATRGTLFIVLGEFLSLPLYALLFYFGAEGMSLERAGAIHIISFAVYLAFNALALAWGWRHQRGAGG